jgi:hypothetical protein
MDAPCVAAIKPGDSWLPEEFDIMASSAGEPLARRNGDSLSPITAFPGERQ